MLKYSQAYLKLPFYIIKNYINHKRHRTVTLTINDVNIGRFDSFAIPLIIHNRIFPIHNVLYSYFNIERRTRIFLFLFLATHTTKWEDRQTSAASIRSVVKSRKVLSFPNLWRQLYQPFSFTKFMIWQRL